MKIYLVKHNYATDSGCGDYIAAEEIVAAFENESDAKNFVEKYGAKHDETIYYNPYAGLDCGMLDIEELEIILHNDFDINKSPYEYGCHLPIPYNSIVANDADLKEFYKKWGEKV